MVMVIIGGFARLIVVAMYLPIFKIAMTVMWRTCDVMAFLDAHPAGYPAAAGLGLLKGSFPMW